jgi:hypothetical protein
MLHDLLTEIVRRRLWPIPLLAAVVAVAAPLLFLKSAPVDAPPAATLAPAFAPDGKLPARAQRLLATSDAGTAARNRGATRASHDPFAPPSRRGSTAKPADEAAAKDSSAAADAPVPVVITNADGSAPKTASTPAPAPAATGDVPPSNLTVSSAAVDVRFGKDVDAKLRRQIPRLETFVARGNVVAVFVKYSPKRDKAVFAIAPSTLITGDVECRRKEGLCRYVDIPAGKHARLTWSLADGSVVSRRLDVVRVNRNG